MSWYPKRCVFSLFIMAILVFSPTALAYTLADYPAPLFIDSKGNFNAIIIIGDYAAVEDVIGAVSILSSLQSAAVKTKTSSSEQIEIPVPIPSSAVKLASEVDDISKHNAIIVGGPCINPSASWLMNYPQPCVKDFKTGIGYVRLTEHANGNYYLLVAGRSAIDTRRAAYLVSNYKNYNLRGIEEQATKYQVDDIILKSE